MTWDHPHDEQLFWVRDRLHLPEPITPLSGTTIVPTVFTGMNGAVKAFDLPIRFRSRAINYYWYNVVMPAEMAGDEFVGGTSLAQQDLQSATMEIGQRWTEIYLPEVREHVAYWEGFDLTSASMPELLDHLDETLERLQRLWVIHFLIVSPVHLARSLFDEFYRELFGDDAAFEVFELLGGLPNLTIEANLAAWRLAQTARAKPDLRALFATAPIMDLVVALSETPGGREFLADLQAYLDQYGKRRASTFELADPSWHEDPTPVLLMLKAQIVGPERDLPAEIAVQTAKREATLAKTRDRLAAYPQAIRERFEPLLAAAQAATIVGEDHSFWIDFRSGYELRHVLLEFGRRLAAAGAIDQADDVFYLLLDEVRDAAEAASAPRLQTVVDERRAEMAHYRTVDAPPALGTPPPGPPPESPLGTALAKYFGRPPQAAPEPGVIHGNPGSSGKIRGRARIITSLTQAGKLQPGDILVAETTTPPWTPLFATAAAVITDTGGILSHCAVVAREYGIPAVVGTGTATTAIQDGQLIEVDGNAGIVKVLDEG